MDNDLLLSSVRSFIDAHALILHESTVVVGLSGGPDSVFLLHALQASRDYYSVKIVAAHLDHEWRPESASELIFCARLCEQWDIPFFSARRSEIKYKQRKGSREEDARNARRAFFSTVAQETRASAVALAHHLQDQQETLIIRLIRGTTLTGLSGIRPRSGLYIHPLLEIDKSLIITYLERAAIPYVVDPTNLSSDYLRNRIRREIIPMMQRIDDRFDANTVRTVQRLQETEQFLENMARRTLDSLYIDRDGNASLIDYSALLSYEGELHRRMLLMWLWDQKLPFTPSERFLREIIRFLQQPGATGVHALSTHWAIGKKNGQAWIIRR